MVSILAGMSLIFLLFTLSTLEGLCKPETWSLPINLNLKKYLMTWGIMIFSISLLIIVIQFLLSFFEYLYE